MFHVNILQIVEKAHARFFEELYCHSYLQNGEQHSRKIPLLLEIFQHFNGCFIQNVLMALPYAHNKRNASIAIHNNFSRAEKLQYHPLSL